MEFLYLDRRNGESRGVRVDERLELPEHSRHLKRNLFQSKITMKIFVWMEKKLRRITREGNVIDLRN